MCSLLKSSLAVWVRKQNDDKPSLNIQISSTYSWINTEKPHHLAQSGWQSHFISALHSLIWLEMSCPGAFMSVLFISLLLHQRVSVQNRPGLRQQTDRHTGGIGMQVYKWADLRVHYEAASALLENMQLLPLRRGQGHVSISDCFFFLKPIWLQNNTKDNSGPKRSLSSEPFLKHILNYDLQMTNGSLTQFMNYVVVMVTLIKKTGSFSRLRKLCLWNWDAWRELHTEPPDWTQGKAKARYWFCQSLRGLLWVQCNNHTPSGTQTDSPHRGKSEVWSHKFSTTKPCASDCWLFFSI